MAKTDPITLELHDWRVLGATGSGPNYIGAYIYPRHTMDVVLGAIQSALGRSDRISRLLIMAHGIHGQPADLTSPLVGIQLGYDLITGGFTTYSEHDFGDAHYGTSNKLPAGHHEGTLQPWARFKGHIDEIQLLSCGAANLSYFHTGVADPDMSGYQMCAKLAQLTGAYVVAAERTQEYQFGYHPWKVGPIEFASKPTYREDWNYDENTPTDFGTWEGPVYVFSPINGTVIATGNNSPTPAYRRGA